MVNGREKFFENIGCFDLQAALVFFEGVDAWMKKDSSFKTSESIRSFT